MSGRGALRAATAAIAAGLTVAGALSTSGVAAFRCPVSKPGARPVPARPSFNVGNARIAVALPPRATFVAVPEGRPGGAFLQANGTIRTKVGWWRARGTLRLSGRRLDGAARPLRADVGPPSWTTNGEFIPSLLYFPTVGCWRITALAGGARLDVVVRVVKR